MTGNTEAANARTMPRTTTARTPFARLSDAADHFSNEGFDVQVDPNDEEKFTIDLSGEYTDLKALGHIISEYCEDNNLKCSRAVTRVIVRV